MASRTERILILAKTYPSPSVKHVETSCVAGITHTGSMRRLYPVPFRMIEKGQQFKKWQWIDVRVEKAAKDHMPESHKLYVDTIVCGQLISSKNGWDARWPWLDRIPAFDSVDDINEAHQIDGLSLALLCPGKLLGLEIIKARYPDWTEEEKGKLAREQMQGNLFTEDEAIRQVKQLRKVPFDFYYRYQCNTKGSEKDYRHKIVDWEAGALYWTCQRDHGKNWEAPFRAMLEENLGDKDLMFLMGNQHRFQHQWLIINLIYPPKRKPEEQKQRSFF